MKNRPLAGTSQVERSGDKDDLVGTDEAARMAGVGPTAVKRWADQGLLPCIRTPGGHRRFSRAGVEALIRRQHGDLGGGLVDLLLRVGDGHAVEGRLLADRARLGAWYLVAEAIAPALVELGARWEAGSISVLEEHLASERLARALTRISGALPLAPSAQRCLLASAEGDDHTLGLALAELCLREAGWNTLWAGRATPTAELERTIRRGEVGLVALSASACSTDALALRRQAEQVGEACLEGGAALALGGTGPWPERPTHGRRFYAFAAFAAWARKLAGDGPLAA